MRNRAALCFFALAALLAFSGCEHKVRRSKAAAPNDPSGTPAESSTHEESAPVWEPAGGGAACQTTCGVDVSSSISGDDQRKIAGLVDPLLHESYDCLKRVGAYKIEPAVLIRIATDGRPSHVRFDVGGYEELQCMHEIERKFPRLQVAHAANVRCDLKCAQAQVK